MKTIQKQLSKLYITPISLYQEHTKRIRKGQQQKSWPITLNTHRQDTQYNETTNTKSSQKRKLTTIIDTHHPWHVKSQSPHFTTFLISFSNGSWQTWQIFPLAGIWNWKSWEFSGGISISSCIIAKDFPIIPNVGFLFKMGGGSGAGGSCSDWLVVVTVLVVVVGSFPPFPFIS